MLGAAVQQASVAITEGGDLVLSFDAAAEAARRVVEHQDSIAILRRCAEEVGHRTKTVRVVASPGPTETQPETKPPAGAQPAPGLDRLSESTPAPSSPAILRAPPTVDHRELLERARHEPGVQKLLREFGAQVVEIRPLETPSLEPEAETLGPLEESP
jgi:hypothetical protein